MKKKIGERKQREIMRQRNSLMMSRMADMSKPGLEEEDSEDDEDTFHGSRSLLDDCLKIMTPPAPRSLSTPNSSIVATPPIIVDPPSSAPVITSQYNSSFSHHVTTPQNTQPPQKESTFKERPRFGGKCPCRKHDQVTDEVDQPQEDYSSCKQLKREVAYPRGQLVLYQELPHL